MTSQVSACRRRDSSCVESITHASCCLVVFWEDSLAMAEKRVKLKSSDDEMFEVEEAVAFESQTVKNMIEDTGMDNPIPLPNVSSKILARVIEYCKYHVDSRKSADDKPATSEDLVKVWDAEFVKVDQATLFDLILVRYLPWCFTSVSAPSYGESSGGRL